MELSVVVTESPAVEVAGGGGEPTRSEDVGAITAIAATEGDGNDAGVEAVVGESAETAETTDMVETADMADTTDAAGPEVPIPEGEAEISETTHKLNVTACAEPGSVGADVLKEAQL